MKQWSTHLDEIKALMRTLRGDTPNVMKAFSGLAQAATTPAALDHGASREEVVETLGMAIYMGAGPSVMYATHALEAYEQLKPDAASTAA